DHDLVVPGATGLLANDTDAENDTLHLPMAPGAPAHGALISSAPDGSFSYRPEAGFVGTDTFAYTVTDGLVNATGTVTIVVDNNVPIALNDTYAVLHGQALVVPASTGLLANDSTPGGGTLSLPFAPAPPAHGTLVTAPDGSFSYQPLLPEFVGVDSFT